MSLQPALPLVRLALADLWHERAITLCQVLAVAAVLAPLLVLFGLREGVISTLVERMNRDPAMRAVVPEVAGANRFDAAWFQRMQARPDVAFVMPNTRAIAGQVDLLPEHGTAVAPLRVSLLPTAAGDPVAGDEGAPLAQGLAGISLAALTAERLGVRVGESVMAAIERQRDGRIEPVSLSLRVQGIVAAERFDGQAAFATIGLLEAVQAYRDGFAVPALGWTGEGEAKPIDAYPLFRLYARSIGDVAGLAADLRREGVGVATREGEIAAALALSRNLTAILLIIAALAAAGYLVSLAASQWANARRKRRELAVLALVGYPPGWLAGFPVVQSAVIAFVGGLVAAVLFGGVAAAINAYFAPSIAQGESACRLAYGDLAGALLATVAVSLLPATVVGLWSGRLQVSEELRDV